MQIKKLAYSLFNKFPVANANVPRLAMIYVSREVKNVFVKFVFYFCFTFLSLFVVFIAVVIVIVGLPVSMAYPAEFESAAACFFLACHVIAALVFFYMFVARWAFLCVYS